MKIKLARIEKGLTQEELCKIVKMSRATLIKIEKGDFSPLSFNKIVSLSKVLGRTPQELFFNKED